MGDERLDLALHDSLIEASDNDLPIARYRRIEGQEKRPPFRRPPSPDRIAATVELLAEGEVSGARRAVTCISQTCIA